MITLGSSCSQSMQRSCIQLGSCSQVALQSAFDQTKQLHCPLLRLAASQQRQAVPKPEPEQLELPERNICHSTPLKHDTA